MLKGVAAALFVGEKKSSVSVASVCGGGVLYCLVLCGVVFCWWTYVGVSAVVCKGLLHKENNNFKNHGAADTQKNTVFQFWEKNAEPLLVNRVRH